MRDKLDDLTFKLHELSYSFRTGFERVPDKVKNITLSFCCLLWLGICIYVYLQSRDYTPADLPESVHVDVDAAEEALMQADALIKEESYGEAFNLLATHRNHFTSEYSKSDMERLETRLIDLTEHAVDADIEAIYASEDLTTPQPVMKFLGIVIEINNDPMYGVTYTVSKTGARDQQQLEVTGLEDVSVNSQVEFFGVPQFESVSSPLKVEAYVVPLTEEG